MKQVGYVKNTLIEGSATGRGHRSADRDPGRQRGGRPHHRQHDRRQPVRRRTERNRSASLLTDAETLNGGFSISGSQIIGNGYGLFNADAKNEAVREGAPATATNDYWGTRRRTPIVGPTVVTQSRSDAGDEHRPRTRTPTKRASRAPTRRPTRRCCTRPVLGAAPADPVVGTQPDLAPVGEIVNPGGGEAVEAGVAVEPVVVRRRRLRHQVRRASRRTASRSDARSSLRTRSSGRRRQRRSVPRFSSKRRSPTAPVMWSTSAITVPVMTSAAEATEEATKEAEEAARPKNGRRRQRR